MDRVIYVIPYTSIIEQNAKVFREILGDENVLENHCNVDYESTDELREMQLATENWDKPVLLRQMYNFLNRSLRINLLNVENYIILQIV